MPLDNGACASALYAKKSIVQVLGGAVNTASQDIHAEREVANTTAFITLIPCVRQRAQ
jgi:hypothetical protein